MLAVGKVIEPEKTRVEMTIEVSQPEDPSGGLELDFGDLPDL